MARGRLGGFFLVDRGWGGGRYVSFTGKVKHREGRGREKGDDLFGFSRRLCHFLDPLIDGINEDGPNVERGAGSRGGG